MTLSSAISLPPPMIDASPPPPLPSAVRNDGVSKKHKKKKRKKEKKKKHSKKGRRRRSDDDEPQKLQPMNSEPVASVAASVTLQQQKVKEVVESVHHKVDDEKDKKKRREKRRRKDVSGESIDPTTTSSSSVAEKKPRKESSSSSSDNGDEEKDTITAINTAAGEGRPFAESSALEFNQQQPPAGHNVTLLLFYQYVEPDWTNEQYKDALHQVEVFGKQCEITGRMRVSREGLNCTLTGSKEGIQQFCYTLRKWKPIFLQTEFKMTHDLPEKQRFPALKIIPVTELVHYGLEGEKAPPIHRYQGTHLEPAEYHKKLAEDNTVVIDVRNHYEAIIGRFDPPTKPEQPKWIDPLMRKSTEFPVWLDDPETKEKLKGKSVLMYCTGGIRCERASALLKYKMDTDPTVKDLNIEGVYQLQGGIDKYFKEFPDGGYWKGKNYVFDKRFAHPPPAVVGDKPESQELQKKHPPMGKCEACSKPWDMFRGKRRCPTCGVPSLICRSCWQAHEDGTRQIDKSIRCDLCVYQNIRSKKDLREKEVRDIQAYESKLASRGLLHPRKLGGDINNSTTRTAVAAAAAAPPNPNNVTRLYLKNMCRKNMTEQILMDFVPGITHIVWRYDRKSGRFFGQGWVEMESPEAAARAVAKSGAKVLGRPLYIEYQPPDGKDAWPPPSSSVNKH